jgi:MFS family permease
MIADGVRCSAIVLLGIMPDVADLNWTIWISAIVFAICDRIALTSSQSMIPVVASHVSLPSANSMVFFLMQAGSLAAAALIGILLYSLTPKETFIALSIGFAASVCLMWPLRRGYLTLRQERPEAPQKWPFDAKLARTGVIYALLYTGGVLVSVIGPSFVLTELAGSAIDFGHLETAWSAGSILGALILIRLTHSVKLQALLIAVVVMTACAFALLKATVLPWSLAFIAVLGMLYNLGRVAIEVTLQLSVPSNALGRAKGVIHSFAVLLGILLFGSIAIYGDEVQPSSFFVAYSIVLAVGAVAIGAWRLITVR